MKFICIVRWSKDCQVIYHIVVHTGEIPELGILANRRQTFPRASWSTHTVWRCVHQERLKFEQSNRKRMSSLRHFFSFFSLNFTDESGPDARKYKHTSCRDDGVLHSHEELFSLVFRWRSSKATPDTNWGGFGYNGIIHAGKGIISFLILS